jgi:hypothetical protein
MITTAILTLGIMAAAVPAARADTTCPPIPPPGSTVNGNLTVTGICTLTNVKVGGNVTVDGVRTSLTVSGGKVGGNISADDCLSVFLDNEAAVGGNVQIQSCADRSGYAGETGPPSTFIRIDGNFRCVDDPSACVAILGKVGGNMSLTGDGSAFVEDNSVGGNVKADDNTGPPILILHNSVGGNVEALGNTNPEGPVVINVISNTIGGNLTCQKGATLVSNTVHGKTNCPP